MLAKVFGECRAGCCGWYRVTSVCKVVYNQSICKAVLNVEGQRRLCVSFVSMILRLKGVSEV